MKNNYKPMIKKTIAVAVGGTVLAGALSAYAAGGVTVADVSNWGGATSQTVDIVSPYLNYNGNPNAPIDVYAGINTLAVTGAGTSDGTYSGFCIDPFHFSDASSTGYSIVSLTSDTAPKSPATLNTATATEIENLWGDFYSPTMNSQAAAGLQIAIWELVSANAVANDGLPPADAVTFSGNSAAIGQAATDLAAMATYSGPTATLEALTGPGQDYVIDIPGYVTPHTAPDGGMTLAMLILSLGALVMARPVILNNTVQTR